MIFSKHNGYGPDGLRTCHKGGGSSKSAEKMEKQRQARIAAAVDAINSIFAQSDRDKLYDEQKDVIYDINSRDVERQYENAERSNRFGLARNGLLGGSVDIDSNAELQRKNNEGLMQATGLADSAAANLKLQDERNRQSLISMAQSDIGSGTAQSLAQQSLANAADNAYADRATASIGSLFDDMGQAYLSAKYHGNSSGDSSSAFNLNNSGGTAGQSNYQGHVFRGVNN
ncbi:hypothetical protein NB640_11830 [Oxalobacter vibrioformis]|uniref:Uncharacterized protein n=1 Tax=Oxalobacter vibrioformis TaxID=933080 RepID=A0A9E9LYK9_9BURK|nr:hypothetical protein [Oxalobacter vibrioformis]WAW09892.1 hypothetical protein NB640_11830 [Oxalobacter vibrioformis]